MVNGITSSFTWLSLLTVALAACRDADVPGPARPATIDSGGGGVGGRGTTSSTGAGGAGGATGALRFAAIGDFGYKGTKVKAVADLVKSWNVEFVITTGDNNYPDGEASTIDANIGQYYADFIGNYQGTYGTGSATNRFWPSPGNHDWHAPDLKPYLDYFTLPGNERYYEVDLGLVHLFVVDSDTSEPDGTSADSAQGKWLEQALARSTGCFDIVFFHHPPYSSSEHGSQERMQWPFEQWGADAVMSGHDHTYERLAVGGIPYFVNGFGGARLYDFEAELPQTQYRYNDKHGAMLMTATKASITYQAFNADGDKLDELVVNRACP